MPNKRSRKRSPTTFSKRGLYTPEIVLLTGVLMCSKYLVLLTALSSLVSGDAVVLGAAVGELEQLEQLANVSDRCELCKG
jgi:hypothetical protein